jgi:hypothetical protein
MVPFNKIDNSINQQFNRRTHAKFHTPLLRGAQGYVLPNTIPYGNKLKDIFA